MPNSYYAVSARWFSQQLPVRVSFEGTFLALRQSIEEFPTYFKQLCLLHKRRSKFQFVLDRQHFPAIEQVAPRCLLEFGLAPTDTLASWLVWRKWLYDLDNRSAQESGYLFEPILTAAIGGVACSPSTSPIKRTDAPAKRRQVDCIDGDDAYEFKMRVTIAASGQGRFPEELAFARDCQSSGFVPILLVLDPTPSSRLDDLWAEYVRFGGRAYVGSDSLHAR